MTNIRSVNGVSTGAAVGLIAVVGIVAALVPALRVRRVEPAHLLRS
jgi:hypothetical protein